MRVCADKDLDKFVGSIVANEGWSVERGARHFIAVSPGGRKLPIPGSHGSHKNLIMWRAQYRRIVAAESSAVH